MASRIFFNSFPVHICMCMCLFVYVYVFKRACLCVCMYVCMCIVVCIYVLTSKRDTVYVLLSVCNRHVWEHLVIGFICVRMWMYKVCVCMYLCMSLCMSLCICMFLFIHWDSLRVPNFSSFIQVVCEGTYVWVYMCVCMYVYPLRPPLHRHIYWIVMNFATPTQPSLTFLLPPVCICMFVCVCVWTCVQMKFICMSVCNDVVVYMPVRRYVCMCVHNDCVFQPTANSLRIDVRWWRAAVCVVVCGCMWFYADIPVCT